MLAPLSPVDLIIGIFSTLYHVALLSQVALKYLLHIFQDLILTEYFTLGRHNGCMWPALFIGLFLENLLDSVYR